MFKLINYPIRVKNSKEKPMPLVFEEVKLECGYRIDVLVENKVVIEIKSVESLNDVHLAQTLWLKLYFCIHEQSTSICRCNSSIALKAIIYLWYSI